MAATKQLISTVTVSTTGISGITFSSIPQTFTDILIVLSARRFESNSPFAVDNLSFLFNETGDGYTTKALYGTGSSVSSFSPSFVNGFIPSGDATSNTFGSAEIYIPNYALARNRGYFVNSVTENNATAARQTIASTTWANTGTITSMGIALFSSTFAVGSTASMYGITSGSGGATVA